MLTALDDLKLESIAVVYPGTKRFSIAANVEAVPLREVAGGKLHLGTAG